MRLVEETCRRDGRTCGRHVWKDVWKRWVEGTCGRNVLFRRVERTCGTDVWTRYVIVKSERVA